MITYQELKKRKDELAALISRISREDRVNITTSFDDITDEALKTTTITIEWAKEFDVEE